MSDSMDDFEFGFKALGAILILWGLIALASGCCHCKNAEPKAVVPATHSCTTDPFSGKVICR